MVGLNAPALLPEPPLGVVVNNGRAAGLPKNGSVAWSLIGAMAQPLQSRWRSGPYTF
jgi:hypothetical protein